MNKLAELRADYELTQKQLAEILDVKQQQVSRWEVKGINPITFSGIEYILDRYFNFE